MSYDALESPNGFSALTVYGTENTGACRLQLIKTLENADAYGDDVRSAMTNIKDTLESKYDNASSEYDYLRHGSIWDEPKDWLTGLRLKERTYSFYWLDLDSTNFAGVKNISLVAQSPGGRTAFVILIYDFANSDDCMSESKAKQTEQF